jgi:hypothetical protein
MLGLARKHLGTENGCLFSLYQQNLPDVGFFVKHFLLD